MSYEQQHAALAQLFPNGRFYRTGDNGCIVTGPRHTHHIMIWDDEASELGLYISAEAEAGFRKRLAGLIIRTVDRSFTERDVILILKWDPEVAHRLPEFSYPGSTCEDALSASGRASEGEVTHE